MAGNSYTPNDMGNYRGKRKPKPTPRAMTPQERFAWLAGVYESYSRGYRFKGTR